ncbi:asparagine synthase (glutamine-hydrolyzing) [Fulvivirgaceae bacterium BMA12]|uniref:asparagine synthase (glutamine-hydrolyzing) n=1 Tax=Agaribacillus aureus TaxID=3051825 RepID=A0ABT8L331_9BACT|nr:asparagine synthase (glutamine-hydrolyzing) [Fulvivirgaceae bacterium BMA12]
MCGIFGEFTRSSGLLDKTAFMQLNALSFQRGPDSSGHYSNDENIQLGFNRLAILDLSINGAQPMHSPSGRYSVVFNGEVYNHLEIRELLVAKNLTFKGTSDTETIVNALDLWGIRPTIERLDGMFGIGIYDHQNKSLHLVRDFAGIKPLHYGISDGHLVFASQYNQVSQHPKFKDKSIDPEILKLYLRQHFIPAPFGILKDTYQVMPGEIVTITHDFQVKKERYWEFPDDCEPDIYEEKEALNFIAEALDLAVRDELLSDVPLGSFLSGGIDSPLICYYAAKNFPQQLKAFTIGSDSKIHDESEDASTYSDFMSLDLLLRKMDSEEAMGQLENAMASLSEPFADPSIIPTYLVSKLAREKVTVALSGDGGDELFFGYERFWSVLKNRSFHRLPSPLKYLLYGTDRALFKNKFVNSNLLFETFGEGHFTGHSRMSEDLVNQIFPDLGQVQIPEAYDVYRYEDGRSVKEILGKMRKAEFYGMMQKTLLKVDRASMANSLEIRVPFLKKSFIEASWRVDPLLSYGPDKKKELLKKLLRSHFPKAPIDNRKRGFSVPLDKWMREGLQQPFQNLLIDNRKTHEDFNIDSARLSALFDQHQSGQKDNKWSLFTIYSLFKWKICQEK